MSSSQSTTATRPAVSLVIPVFNGGSFLAESLARLESFLEKTGLAAEVIVVDDGFAGDVELLYIALKYNLAIRRIPVRLLRTGRTTVSVVGHSLPMLRTIAGLRRRWASGGYKEPGLRKIAEQRYWSTATDD